jgi:hypothetical protein
VHLDGRDLPLLYSDLPTYFVRMHHRFELVSEEVVIIRIAHAALLRQDRGKYHDAVVKAAMDSMGSGLSFDVFIAYDSASRDDAEFWAQELRNRGNRVYINEPRTGEIFEAELGAALVDSRVLLPLVSPKVSDEARQTENERGSVNWVETEIRLWLSVFEKNPDSENIAPVALSGAETKFVIDGCTPILAAKPRSLDAIESADRHIKRIISKQHEIPKSTERLWLPDNFR